MEDREYYGPLRDFWEPGPEVARARAAAAPYHNLVFKHSCIRKDLKRLVKARRRLQVAGEFADADQRRESHGFLGPLSIPRENPLERSELVRLLESKYDCALGDLRSDLLYSECVLDKLVRASVASTARACQTTGAVIIATVLQRYLLAGFGSLSIRGTDIWTIGLRLCFKWTAYCIVSLGVASYCRFNTLMLRKKMKTDPSIVGEEDLDVWDGWAWFILNWVVLPIWDLRSYASGWW